jgi:hypothetical protein
VTRRCTAAHRRLNDSPLPGPPGVSMNFRFAGSAESIRTLAINGKHWPRLGIPDERFGDTGAVADTTPDECSATHALAPENRAEASLRHFDRRGQAPLAWGAGRPMPRNRPTGAHANRGSCTVL